MSSFAFLYSLPFSSESSSRGLFPFFFFFYSFTPGSFFSLSVRRRGTSYPSRLQPGASEQKRRRKQGREHRRDGTFKGKEELQEHEHYFSRNFSTVSKASLIFFCDAAESRVINHIFVLLTVKKRACVSIITLVNSRNANYERLQMKHFKEER